MAASVARVQRKMSVERTLHDTGTVLRVAITVYDNGIVSINGEPLSVRSTDPLAWLEIVREISQHVEQFAKDHPTLRGQA